MGRSHSNLSQKTTVQPIKGDRAEQREGRHTHSRKNNSEPRKPQYSQQRRPRVAKKKKRSSRFTQGMTDALVEAYGKHQVSEVEP